MWGPCSKLQGIINFKRILFNFEYLLYTLNHVDKLSTSNMKNKPLVSIITPSFNQGRFIKHTIESVLNQTYPNIEYIIIDGASNDETIDILNSYSSKFKWISEPDNGQANAINKGFALSKGDICSYLNSDDVLFPSAVEKAVKYFDKHPECDMLYGKAQHIDENGEFISMYNTDEYSFKRLMKDCCICQPSAFWRKRMAQTVGLFNDKFHCSLDYEYWLRIAVGGKCIHYYPEILASSRVYPDTKTISNRNQAIRENIQICVDIGGYVHLLHFLELWYNLINEHKEGLTSYLKWIPGFFKLMGMLHFLLFHFRHVLFIKWNR